MKTPGINRDRALDYLSGLSVEIKRDRERTEKPKPTRTEKDGKRLITVA